MQKNQEYTKTHRVVVSIPIYILDCLWSLRAISVNDLHEDSYQEWLCLLKHIGVFVSLKLLNSDTFSGCFQK